MIAVKQGPPPRILTNKAQKWLTALLAAKSAADRKRCEARYGHGEVKAGLKSVFQGKCAYCESKILHVDYGHIDHYVPKNGPRGDATLTFEWTNLLLACGVCNGAEYKGTKFPSAQEGGPFVNR